MKEAVFSRAVTLSEQLIPFILVTILKTEGSTSRNQGYMLVESDGRMSGTIGGGALEAYAQSQAIDLLSGEETYRHLQFRVDQGAIRDAGTVYMYLLKCNTEATRAAFPSLLLWQKQDRFHVLGIQILPEPALLGLCEGGATIGAVHPRFLSEAKEVLMTHTYRYIEDPAWTCLLSLPLNAHTLVLVGGGHVNQAIAELAYFLGIPYQVVETRIEFATIQRFPHARALVVEPTLAEALAQVETNARTAVIIASHAFNEETARALLRRDIPYLGVLGSRHKAKQLLTKLQLSRTDLKRLYCPIGLDLGTETPQEIALSVLSEVMKVFNHRSGSSLKHQARQLVVVRGGGDLATGVILRLHRGGYRVIVLEVEQPTVIRTTVSFAQAMFTKTTSVEGVEAKKCTDINEAFDALENGIIPLLSDPNGESIQAINPICVVDAIMAKRNLGTRIDDAPLVIALGPGFEAGTDCDLVIETMRGHSLARILHQGSARPNTGVPGLIEGFGEERVLHSSQEGIFNSPHKVGDLVKKGDVIATVGDSQVVAEIDGKLRGLLNSGLYVSSHFKIADIDPRGEKADHTTVSEKAMAIGGSVLEAIDGFVRFA
ncbi:MAG: selenium-dependent molybdenum cofactor biosynthesis protein YqeB [Sphaerochaeta sp.]|uniref:selenium-dependent molybdenum cofactor biosynthesis protein YqeB n=1 Tax=Sphaerochaeta sp. TaxID=1972642 RepID=UPI002FC78DA4